MFDEKLFKAYISLKGATLKDVAENLEISTTTLHRKIRRDGDFSREEITKLIEYLNISTPEPIFFTKELAETQKNVSFRKE